MSFETIDVKKDKKGHQAIRIPTRLQINDDKAYLKKVGETLYVIPFHNPWQTLLESADSFTSDFMERREQPDEQERESFES